LEIINPDIEKYIDEHTTSESPVLQKINRETHLYELMPRMLSGHVQGRFLSMISKMISPGYILEIGTYTGYSALCLAEGLTKKGQFHTIDINEELKEKNRRSFNDAGYGDQIIQHIGNALEIIPKLDFPFDLVFIDADKGNYLKYYQLVLESLRPGALILADNVLWSGKVLNENGEKIDKDTQAIIDFNEYVQQDKRVENVLVSIRDGLFLIRKL